MAVRSLDDVNVKLNKRGGRRQLMLKVRDWSTRLSSARCSSNINRSAGSALVLLRSRARVSTAIINHQFKSKQHCDHQFILLLTPTSLPSYRCFSHTAAACESPLNDTHSLSDNLLHPQPFCTMLRVLPPRIIVTSSHRELVPSS
jgi:hypothetical protein